MKVQEKIRSMRESKNWSQEEMATKLNMSVNGYSKIERGETNPHISKLEQIAKELNVDLLELMSHGKSVYLITDNSNHGCNVIGSSAEIAFEIQKLKSDLEHKNEIIELQKRDILRLEEMLELMKSVNLERT
ncbi:MAG: helix-turn-helix transcriptional regulator [Methylococcaceae bacterium]|jgi:transcriptional regulator with XRE-family HTH domain